MDKFPLYLSRRGFLHEKTRTSASFMPGSLFHFVSRLHNDWVISPGGALRYFLGGYVPPGTPNWHPVLKTNSFKIDTPF